MWKLRSIERGGSDAPYSIYWFVTVKSVLKKITRSLLLCFCWKIIILTYSKVQSPSWEANRFSVSQEILFILWNPNVHYRLNKFGAPVPFLTQLDPAHTNLSYFLMIHLISNIPSKSASLIWTFFPMLPHQNPIYTSPPPHTHYMPK